MNEETKIGLSLKHMDRLIEQLNRSAEFFAQRAREEIGCVRLMAQVRKETAIDAVDDILAHHNFSNEVF
jgi:hypothetical protein